MTRIEGRTFHMQATIPFMVELLHDLVRRGKPQDAIESNGVAMSFAEAYKALANLRAAGYTLFPCCSTVDTSGKCLGEDLDNG